MALLLSDDLFDLLVRLSGYINCLSAAAHRVIIISYGSQLSGPETAWLEFWSSAGHHGHVFRTRTIPCLSLVQARTLQKIISPNLQKNG